MKSFSTETFTQEDIKMRVILSCYSVAAVHLLAFKKSLPCGNGTTDLHPIRSGHSVQSKKSEVINYDHRNGKKARHI